MAARRARSQATKASTKRANSRLSRTASTRGEREVGKRSTTVMTSSTAMTSSPLAEKQTDLGSKRTPLLFSGWMAFSLLFLALIAFGVWKRNWVVAGLVNNRPVWGFEVLEQIDHDYRAGALGAIIDEKVILGEARKRNAVPTNDEVKARMAELENKYGGAEVFNQLITQQGETREKVEKTVRLQVAMEKMFGNETVVTDQEIDDYLNTNKDSLTATDSAGKREEAKGNLTSQKQQQVFSARFEEMKTNAKVTLF